MHFEREKWAQGIARPPAERNIVPYLKGQGISVIDKLILTHDDTDHVGELSTLSQHFTIKKIYIGWGAGRNEPLRRHLTEAQKMALKSLKSNMATGSKAIMIFMY